MNPVQPFHLCDYKEPLGRALAAEDSLLFSRTLDSILTAYFSPALSPQDAFSICCSILHFISGSVSEPHLLFSHFDPMEELRAVTDTGSAKIWLLQFKQRVLNHFDRARLEIVHPTIDQIVRYLYAHPCEDLSLQTIADRFSLSPRYISNLFSKESKLSFSDYARLSKMRYARKMLLDSSLSIQALSDRLGYRDPYYFSKVFKQATGLSPKKYQLLNLTCTVSPAKNGTPFLEG